MKFAVSVITPPNYQHSEAFREVGETIHYGLLGLGYNSVLTSLTNCHDRQHIILGANLLPFYQTTLPAHSIFYNLEQVKLDSPWLQPALLDLFRAYPLWDYSQSNIEQLTKIGITHNSSTAESPPIHPLGPEL